MVAGQTKQSTDQPRRAIVFRALAGVLSIGLLIAGLFEFIPAWIVKDAADQPHLWHIAELSALSIFLLGACMLGMLRKPEEKPLLAQFFVLSTIILAIGITPSTSRDWFSSRSVSYSPLPIQIALRCCGWDALAG
jgi:hypothetical protein